MDKLSKCFIKKIPDWFITLCLAVILLIALLPVYRLAFYAFPYYDDFNYGINVKYAYEKGGGLTDILEAAKTSTDITYNTWQGTYSSVFLMTLMPADFGYQYYFIGIFAIITMFVMGIFYLTYTLGVCFFKTDRIKAFNLALFVTFMNLELFYEAQQGIYWYNSSVHYTFMHSLMFVLVAETIRILYAKRKSAVICHMILATILAFAVAGANFVTALQGILIILTVFLCGIFGIKKRALFVLPPLLVFLAGMTINVLAPGNEARKALYLGVAKGPLEAVMLSFASAFKNLGQFTGFPFWAFIVALIPVSWAVGFSAKGKFRLPGLVTLLSFCFYATGFTPSWYGMGEEGLARTFCAIKMVFLLLIAINMVYWFAWLKGKTIGEKTERCNQIFCHKLLIYLISLALLITSFLVSKNQAGNFLSYGAYYYVHTGEALNYYNEHLVMDTLIKDAGDSVELEPFIWKPWFLSKQNEIDTNPDFEQNKAIAKWYGKSEICIRE